MFGTAFKDGYNLSEYAYGALSFIYTDLFLGINAGIGALSSIEGNFGNDQDYAANLNLSRKFGFLGIGANLKYVGSQFYRDTESTQFTGDAGILADFGIVSLGISGHNLFGDFYGPDGERIRPYASGGAALNLAFPQGFGIIVSAEGFQPDVEKYYFTPKAGLQISYSYFALRGGYEYDERTEKKNKFSAGLGVDFEDIQFEYAYVPDEESKIDRHKASLSYRFKQFRVKNKQFNRQLELEKEQAKADSMIAKMKHKDEIEYDKQKHQTKKHLSASIDEDLPLQAVSYDKDEYEFVAILAPVETSGISSESVKEEKPPSGDYYTESKTKNDDFDAAKYLLELENSKASANSVYQKTETKMIEAKEYTYQPTPYSDNDYDPAKDLLKSSLTKLAKPKSSKGKETAALKKNNKAAYAKNVKRKTQKNSYDDDDFDAAKYILENPSENKKVKQSYVKPTEYSTKDFDPAVYLINNEKKQ